MQLAGILGSHGTKLVPDVSVTGAEGGGGATLAGMLMGRMIGPVAAAPAAELTVKHGRNGS